MAESPSAPEEVNEKKQRRQDRRQMKKFWCCRADGAVFLYTESNIRIARNVINYLGRNVVIKLNLIQIWYCADLFSIFVFFMLSPIITFSPERMKWNLPYLYHVMVQISFVLTQRFLLLHPPVALPPAEESDGIELFLKMWHHSSVSHHDRDVFFFIVYKSKQQHVTFFFPPIKIFLQCVEFIFVLRNFIRQQWETRWVCFITGETGIFFFYTWALSFYIKM